MFEKQFVLYYDEDLSRTESEITEKIESSINSFSDIDSVDFEKILLVRPYEVVVTITYENTKTSPEEIQLQLSQLEFLHNARQV